MKLIWIGAFVLVIASLASLVSNQQSGKLIDESWRSASRVLPDTKLRELQRSTPAYTAEILARLPEPVRQKFAAKTWQALELIILRSSIVCHAAPALFVVLMVGFLEGSWARANQKALVKMHSPMRFSLALTSLGFIPVLALLWVAAPLAVSATLLVFALGTLGLISTHNLVVHAPTQF
jgi:hypothetical protein